MEKFKVIINKAGEKTEFVSGLSENEAINEATRYIDLVLKTSNAVEYIKIGKAKLKNPGNWEQWFSGDGYYVTNQSLPQLILSDKEMKKGLERFSYKSLIDVSIEKEES